MRVRARVARSLPLARVNFMSQKLTTALFSQYLKEVYNTKEHRVDSQMPSRFPYLLICVSVLNSLVTYLFEKYPVPILSKIWLRKTERKRRRTHSD